MPPPTGQKAILLRYLDVAHEAVSWKLDGLSEYDLRRPLTPTGSNLLGLMKHLATVELGYFGETFERPHGRTLAAYDENEPNADLYARADETSGDIRALFSAARDHAFDTIEALDLDTLGHVPWWGDNNPVTLRLIIVHVTTEIYRHLGQIDILRESVDGSVGLREGNLNTASADDDFWPTYHDMVERVAASFR